MSESYESLESKCLMQEQEIKNLKKQLETAKENVRTAVADYMQSEGCSCCRDSDGHKIHEKILAELLDAPMYGDGSGYDFRPFSTSELKKKLEPEEKAKELK